MHPEKLPPAGDERTPRIFDNIAVALYTTLSQKMDIYVSKGYCDNSLPFGDDAERIDAYGRELAYVLTEDRVVTQQDIRIAQRSLRYGLTLARMLTQSPHATAGLGSLENLFPDPDALKREINDSNQKYLINQRNLIVILRGNLTQLAPTGQGMALDIISFVLQEAEQGIIVEEQMGDFDTQLDEFFNTPPEGDAD